VRKLDDKDDDSIDEVNSPCSNDNNDGSIIEDSEMESSYARSGMYGSGENLVG
jgi:hypothetical protein